MHYYWRIILIVCLGWLLSSTGWAQQVTLGFQIIPRSQLVFDSDQIQVFGPNAFVLYDALIFTVKSNQDALFTLTYENPTDGVLWYRIIEDQSWTIWPDDGFLIEKEGTGTIRYSLDLWYRSNGENSALVQIKIEAE